MRPMLTWHWEKVCSPSRRRSLVARTDVGTFRIVPNDFLPLIDLMADRSAAANSYEVHFLRRGCPGQVLGKEAMTLEAAKDFAHWHFARRRCA
jgi:hypothetical protein